MPEAKQVIRNGKTCWELPPGYSEDDVIGYVNGRPMLAERPGMLPPRADTQPVEASVYNDLFNRGLISLTPGA
jgi:hypothetical protein